MQRTDYHDLPPDTRAAIESRTGPVLAASTASAGLNSAVAVRLRTATGTVFVKGLRTDHPGVVTQQREAVINTVVQGLAPRLLWQLEVAGWNLLCFEHITGRHADYRPGSADLPAVVDTIQRLGRVQCPDVPDLPLKRADQRWAAHVREPADVEHFAGDTLLHTDFNPLNILIHHTNSTSNTSMRAWIVDWAWPTRGAAFIDPACLVLRLIHNGHRAAHAEAWAQRTNAWKIASRAAVDAFAHANAHLWKQIADNDPQPWKRRMATAARQWIEHRSRQTHPAPVTL